MWNGCKLIKNNQFPASMAGCSLGSCTMECRNFLQPLFQQIDRKKLSAWDLLCFPEYFLGEKQGTGLKSLLCHICSEHTSEPALAVPSQTQGPVEFPRGSEPGQCEAPASAGTAATAAPHEEIVEQSFLSRNDGFWHSGHCKVPLLARCSGPFLSCQVTWAPALPAPEHQEELLTHISKAQQILENLGYILFLDVTSVLGAPWRLSVCLLLVPLTVWHLWLTNLGTLLIPQAFI